MTRLVALAVLLLTGVALAAELPAPTFVLHSAGGAPATGPLERLEDSWSVTLGGARPVRAAGGDFVSLRRAGTPLPAPPTSEQAVFANGDRLPGRVLRLDGERLRWRTSFGDANQELALPLSALSVIWVAAPDGAPAPKLLRELARAKRRRDAVYLRNGDVLEGILTGCDREKSQTLQLEVDRKAVQVEFNKVAAVALSTELARALRPRGAYGHLVLANGGRLALASGRADPRRLTGKTLFGAEVEVPVGQVMALDVYQGPAVYLSDLKPAGYEFRSYLGGERLPYVLDGSVAGADLCLRSGTYDKGLGMHSESRLTYDLGGAYRRFEALVGLDERTGREGSVRVKVLVDGKAADVGGDQELTRHNGPRQVRVAVAGARELTLVVEFGRRGHVQDQVDWVDARLSK